MTRKILPAYISKIKELLNREEARLSHRHTFILAGDESWQKNILKDILQGHKEDSLWVAEKQQENFPFVETKKADSWLGKEKKVVIFDANNNFDPDSFAAISGIVVGGGIFFLLLPTKDEWGKVYSSLFGQRFIQSIRSSSYLVVITEDANDISYVPSQLECKKSPSCTAPFLTLDQQNSVLEIESQVLSGNLPPVVLISDRGRGKSAALGISVAMLLKKEIKNVVITAPRLHTADVFFKHLSEMLTDATVTRSCVKYKNSVVQFYSPDQLVKDDIKADVLIIDEAAAIPVPLLTSFLYKYPQCIFATTVHGYEGTGRGFTLRFFKELDIYNSRWVKLLMQAPIRWADNDPLEKWMFNLLCLNAELTDVSKIGDVDNIEQQLISKDMLVDNERLLNEVFSLLVLAHYRTRPKDLESVLDDETISLYLTFKNNHVIAVALVTQEGGFSDELSRLVYRGERRPQGHLLAQALTYHCGVENAATLNYARVMRIAVHPQLQNRGVGHSLLDFIVENEKNLGRDAIGSSYGMNARLLSFWKASGFNVVRIGFKREKTSGEHAAIMMRALNQQGEKVYEMAAERFCEQLPYWFDDVLQDLPLEIKQSFPLCKKENNLQISISDKKDISSFIKYSRNYELCIAALNKLVLHEQQTINEKTFPDDFKQVLIRKVIEKKHWKDIAVEMGLNGKSDSRELFKKAIIRLLN